MTLKSDAKTKEKLTCGFKFSVPTDVIDLFGKIRIRKSCYFGGQAM